MDMDTVGDTLPKPEMLQLREMSPLVRKLYPYVVEELFSQWLSLPETGRLVKSLIADVKSCVSLNVTENSVATNVASSRSLASVFSFGSTPPLSPRSSSGSPHTRKQRVGQSSLSSSLKLVNEPVEEVIPQFYFTNGRPPPNHVKEEFLSKVNQFFSSYLGGVQIKEFKLVTKDICKFPSFLSTTLFRKIDINCNGNISREQFIDYWIMRNMLTMDLPTQVYTILKEPGHNYLVQDDFRPALQELLATHTGLEFLRNTSEFQERYAETVIYRIFYYVNRSCNGRLTLRELKHSDLISVMQHVDKEEDINRILKYFSYEHFYVIYCKFWELDHDHDFFIEKEDVIRYGNYALTFRVVDRIFSQAPRKFTSTVQGKMSYEDFVYFILAEEDKSSEPSLEYWFKCIDLDGNGMLTRNEMLFFYEEQLHRMECMDLESVLFEDVLCQIFDMIGPQDKNCIKFQDIRDCKLAGNVFNILFNLKKFIAYESRDPFLIRQEREEPSLTEWEHFAHREYIRFAMEEDASNGSGDAWDESPELPI